MLKSSSKRSKNTKKPDIPVIEYVAPEPVKKPPPTLYLFSNQMGLGRSFRERIG